MERRRWLHALAGLTVAAQAGMVAAQVKTPAAGAKAAAPPNEKAARAALEKRVAGYWEARKGSDLGAAYTFYSPEFRAATARPVYLREYQRLIRFPPEKFKVEAIEFQPGGLEATVKVRLDLTRNIEGQSVALSGVTDETWVYAERNWWKKDEPLKINI